MNKLRTMLNEHKHPLGTFVSMGNANTVEAIGQSEMDFIIIDNEHGPFDLESSLECIRAAQIVGLAPLCRVRENSRSGVMKLLDHGAAGLIVPYIETVEQVKELIAYSKFLPVGKRGYGTTRKDFWGSVYPATESFEEQMAYWNRETFVIPQCETAGCLEHIEEITALEGVDGIFVGPFDLSISMGIPGQFQSEEMLAAFRRILNACKAAGKFSIIFTANPDWVKGYYDMGFDMVTCGTDAAITVKAFRDLTASIQR